MKLQAAGRMEPQKLAWAKLSAPSTRPHWQGITSTGHLVEVVAQVPGRRRHPGSGVGARVRGGVGRASSAAAM